MVKQKVSISIDKEIIDFIDKNAKHQHISFSTMINQILWEKKDLIIKDIKEVRKINENLKKARKEINELKGDKIK